MTALLSVQELSVSIGSKSIVDRVSFSVAAREVLAIVGESGSGKSMSAKALMGLLPPRATTSGTAVFDGQNVLDRAATPPRGTGIGLIFQEPMTALTPVLTIGLQLTEALESHGICNRAEARKRAITMLERVGIPQADKRMGQYPHELSGGMRQRVVIAMMMLLGPRILIADEPTTALDVTVQAQILDLLRELVTETQIGLILITHDMGVVAEMADQVLVMKSGRAVEQGTAEQIFAAPKADYTRALLAAVPRIDRESDKSNIATHALLSVEEIHKTFPLKTGLVGRKNGYQALQDISLTMQRGETLAVVGESGSGKTTLGRIIARLTEADSGRVQLNGMDLTSLSGQKLRSARRDVQMVFQDPYASLNPRQTIGRTIAEPLILHDKLTKRERSEAVDALLHKVGLSADMAHRYPHEFSGGQRQRIAIARALAAKPTLMIADEPTSALDVSIQAQILDLLEDLKSSEDLTMMFISHDLAVVRQIADRVAVMRAGAVMELGATHDVFAAPQHPYTRDLIDAAPIPDPARKRGKRPPLTAAYQSGPLQEVVPGHWVAS